MKYIITCIITLAFASLAFYTVYGGSETMVKEPKAVGIHLFRPKTAEQSAEMENKALNEVLPYFKDVPGVIQVSILKGIWADKEDEPPPIGVMILFKSQDALQTWWKELPDEEKERQTMEMESYKDIEIIRKDFLIMSETEPKLQ